MHHCLLFCLFLADQIFYRSCVYRQHFRFGPLHHHVLPFILSFLPSGLHLQILICKVLVDRFLINLTMAKWILFKLKLLKTMTRSHKYILLCTFVSWNLKDHGFNSGRSCVKVMWPLGGGDVSRRTYSSIHYRNFELFFALKTLPLCQNVFPLPFGGNDIGSTLSSSWGSLFMCQRARRVGKRKSAFRHVCFDRTPHLRKIVIDCGQNLILFDMTLT